MTQAPAFTAESLTTKGRAARKYTLLSAGSVELTAGACDALLVGTAGTANITQPDGTDVDSFPLQAGYNPISILKLRALGTATGVWALYY